MMINEQADIEARARRIAGWDVRGGMHACKEGDSISLRAVWMWSDLIKYRGTLNTILQVLDYPLIIRHKIRHLLKVDSATKLPQSTVFTHTCIPHE